MRGLKKKMAAIGLFVASLMMATTVFAAAGSFTPSSVPEAENPSSVTAANGLKVENLEDKLSILPSDEFLLKANSVSGPIFKNEDKIVAIIELEEESLLGRFKKTAGYASVSDYAKSGRGRTYTDALTSRIDTVKDVIASDFEVKFKYDYTSILTGFAAEVRYGDIDKIKAVPGVKSVIISENYERPKAIATENVVNVFGTGIYDSSDVGFTGAGTLVAVLDTGLDYTHTAFANTPHKLAMTKDDLSKILERTIASSINGGLTEDDVYMSAKVPFGFDYADNDPDVYPAEDHGTHVAGIIAGKDDEITGVAVDAQLAIFKVFSNDYNSGGSDAGILAAVSDAVTLGADVINMSLGSSAGFSREVDREGVNEIYDSVREAGISLIVAASNDYSSAKGGEYGDFNLLENPDSGTVGAPATYDSAMAVASISGVKTSYLDANGGEAAVYVTEASNSTGKKGNFVTEILGDKDEETIPYVTVPGLGYAADYIGLDVNGKIALVKRGINTFEDKCKFAMNAGARGVIIYNNVSGTIAMSVGAKITIPACSTSMDAGNILAARESGTLYVSKSNLAGPFMSDFSSWGVLPNLELKPEITAHGGEIYSSVPGGGYDRISGTSMAAPNMAGATTLVRQYVKEKYPEFGPVEVTDMVYRLMMSTATIARNEDGNPYSPRKQGSGLAAIKEAVTTGAYLYVEGSNKTKLSLGDDVKRTGEYTLNFKLKNISDSAKSYKVSASVMTESISSDEKTVAEKPYMLSDASVSVGANGKGAVIRNGVVSVPGYGEADITLRIKLTTADKDYLDKWFKNGMFVEGFALLESMNEDKIDLSVPYCAFYGDWAAAPILDASAYEVTESLNDTDVLDKDKLKASVFESIPMGAFRYEVGTDSSGNPVYEDGIWGLGDFGYRIDKADKPRPVEDKAAISSRFNSQYKLSGVYLGTLRGIKYADVQVINDNTGDVIYSDTKYNIRKSVYDSGNRRPGFVDIELDAAALGLADNTKYTVYVKGHLDWEGGGENVKDLYKSSFYIDSEAPELETERLALRVEEDLKKNKRYYLDMYVYDNHYLQCMKVSTFDRIANGQLVGEVPFHDNMLPITDSGRNTTNKMSFEITDFYDKINQNGGKVYLQFIDYAKNSSEFSVTLPYCDTTEVEFKSSLSSINIDINGYYDVMKSVDFYKTSVNSEGEVTREKSYPDQNYVDSLIWELENPEFAFVDNGKIWGKKAGETVLKLKTPQMEDFVSVPVKVSSKDAGTVELMELKMSEKKVSLEQGEGHSLTVSILPANITQSIRLEWTSNNPAAVKVVQDPENMFKAEVFAVDSGSATVTVKAFAGDRELLITGTSEVTVKETFKMDGSIIESYTGRGDENGVLVIPEKLGALGVQAGAFFNNKYITKIVLPEGMQYLYESCFYGMSSLEEVVLPSTITELPRWAFGWCEKLSKINLEHIKLIKELCFYRCNFTELDLPSTVFIGDNSFSGNRNLKRADLTKVNYIGKQGFYGCESLTDVKFRSTVEIMDAAFADCDSLVSVELPGNVFGEFAFAYCNNLTSVTFTGTPIIGIGAFSSLPKLNSVNFMNGAYDIGKQAFYNCTSLASVTLPAGLEKLGDIAFASCTSLSTVNIAAGAKISKIGKLVFSGCSSLRSINVEEGNAYFASNGGILYDKNMTRLAYVPAAKDLGGMFEVPSSVKVIGAGAFTDAPAKTFGVNLNNVERIETDAFTGTYIQSVTGSKLKYIGANAFYGCTRLTGLPVFEGLEYIGAQAFYNCSGVGVVNQTLALPESLYYVGEAAFAGVKMISSVILPENMTETAPSMFVGCENLASVEFNSNLKVIAERTFSGTGLTSVVIPASVETIGEAAFASCAKLTSVEIPDSITEIPALCFQLTALTSVELPESVKRIGNAAFAFNLRLSSITLPGVEIIDSGAFAGTALRELTAPKAEMVGGYIMAVSENDSQVTAYRANNTLVKVSLPSAVSLAQFAFYNCLKLSDLNIPSAEYIGAYAFYYNTSLAEVTLSSAQIVDAFAFANCEKLSKIVFGENLSYLGGAFIGGTAVSSVILPAKATEIKEGAFYQAFALKSVNVSAENEVYLAYDDVLYRKEENGKFTLHTYPAAKPGVNYVIMEGVIRLGNYAFSGNKNIADVTLPRSLKIVGADAFNGCASLKVYRFQSPNAPVLENFYNQNATSNISYRNFTGESGTVEGIRMVSPKNGKGYDSYVYRKIFFNAELNSLGENALEDSTVEANAAIALIPEEITLADRRIVETARTLYNTVSRDQREFVIGYQALLAAEIKLSDLKVKNVIALINALGKKPGKDQILEARNAYDELTDAEKENVTNYKKLTDAEKGRSDGGCGAGFITSDFTSGGGTGLALMLLCGCALVTALRRRPEVRSK